MTHPLTAYNDMLKLLDADESSRKDVYQELINKEKEVLDVITRVANQREDQRSKTFLDNSITEIIARFAYTWKNVITEMIDSRGNGIVQILLKEERKIYVGIMILLVALLVTFIEIAQ